MSTSTQITKIILDDQPKGKITLNLDDNLSSIRKNIEGKVN